MHLEVYNFVYKLKLLNLFYILLFEIYIFNMNLILSRYKRGSCNLIIISSMLLIKLNDSLIFIVYKFN